MAASGAAGWGSSRPAPCACGKGWHPTGNWIAAPTIFSPNADHSWDLSRLLFRKRFAYWDDCAAKRVVGHLRKRCVHRQSSAHNSEETAKNFGVRDTEIAGGEQEVGDPQRKEHQPDGLGLTERGNPHAQGEDAPERE